MGNKILINLLILTGLSTYAAQAQEGWTLRQCIDYAIEHNISVQQTANSAEQGGCKHSQMGTPAQPQR